MTRNFFIFFFTDTAPTEIYTLSLHDALPISAGAGGAVGTCGGRPDGEDRLVLLAAGHLDLRHQRSEEHTSELQSPDHLVCRLLLEKKKVSFSLATYVTNRSDMDLASNSLGAK